jgi:hypothetical protein
MITKAKLGFFALFLIILIGVASAADTGFLSPTANSNNGWNNPTYAYASDNNRASASSSSDVVDYSNFSFSIPTGATINGIEVSLEASTTGRQIDVELSGDGGAHWTSSITSTTISTESTTSVGGISNTWGKTWIISNFTNTNFKVRLTARSGGSTYYLDQLLIRVTYTPACTPNTYYRDADGDTYGNLGVTTQACTAPAGYVSDHTDCNDADSAIHPGATEICDNKDNNCNGQIDEGVKTNFFQDLDGDLFGNALITTQACSAPQGYVSDNTDCNDNNTAIHPNAAEKCNNIDDNCNGLTDEGFNVGAVCSSNANSCGDTNQGNLICSQDGLSSVCNSQTPNERLNWSQVCNSQPNICGLTNSGLTDCNGNCLAETPAVIDSDGDGIPDCQDNCVNVANPNQEDCNKNRIGDACDDINPSATEICDNIDNNCNGEIDEGLTQPAENLNGACSENTMFCSAGNWYDYETNYIPTRETCNNIDDNCNGETDENYICDINSPTISLDSPINNYLTNSSSISLIFTPSDEISPTMNCILNSGFGTTPYNNVQNGVQINYTALSPTDGIYSWNVTCTDLAGNTGESIQQDYTIDTTAPKVTLYNPTQESYINTSDIPFDFIYSDNFDNSIDCELYINGQFAGNNLAANGIEYNSVYAGASDGINSLFISCTDDAGNTGQSAENNFIVDTMNPSVAIENLIDGQLVYGIWKLSASANDPSIEGISPSGINYIEFYYASTGTLIGQGILDRETHKYLIDWDTTTVADGKHEVYAVAYDNAGNSMESEHVNVLVGNIDSDNDEIPDVQDNIIGTVNDIQGNQDNLTFSVDQIPNPNNWDGLGHVILSDEITGDILVEFDYNFGNGNVLNLSAVNITINPNEGNGGIIIQGIDLTSQGLTKTAYINKTSTSNTLCIIDKEVASISVTDDCTNGIKLTCDGTNGAYTCTTVTGLVGNSMYKIDGLSHSGLTQYSYTAPAIPAPQTSGGGGGGSTCVTKWNCTEWNTCLAIGIQSRTCSYPANFCAPKQAKPIEMQSCTYTAPQQTTANEETTTPVETQTPITGAVTGTSGNRNKIIIIIASVLFLIIVIAVISFIRKKRKNKSAKTLLAQL